MKSEELLDLGKLMECEVIRFASYEDMLDLLVVGDNEEEEHHHHDTEDDEDDEECHDECCEGLNGHLFLLRFHNVSAVQVTGEECDNYKTIKVISEKNFLSLELEGSNFNDEDDDVTLSFHYDDYEILDKGEIKGPDA